MNIRLLFTLIFIFFFIQNSEALDGYCTENGEKCHMLGGVNSSQKYVGFILNSKEKDEDLLVLRNEFGKAFAIYKNLCDRNDIDACHNLGLMYIRGLGVEKNIQMGLPFLKKSMEKLSNWNTANLYYQKALKELEKKNEGSSTSVLSSNRPSFDCKLARSKAEKIICDDATLSALDRELNEYYKNARSLAKDKNSFQEETLFAWKDREKNCFDKNCLLSWYYSRKSHYSLLISNRNQEKLEEKTQHKTKVGANEGKVDNPSGDQSKNNEITTTKVEISESDDSKISTDNRKRFALVIGNGNYSSLSKLPNAINDARTITKSLRASDFQVSTYENLDLAGMQNAVRSFGEKLGKNDVGLVYYAGHGVQVKGKNYLIPVSENIKKSFEVPSSAVDVDLVLATLEHIKNDLNIVVLDACRSSFPGEARGTNRGLATIEAAKGTFIAFATSPGKEALDGSGSNSPYTKHLARLIGKKGLPLEQVFKEVRKAVVAETNGEQVPWENSSLMGDFYFQK
jgi:uncharacterized protein